MSPRPQIDHVRRPQILAAAAEVIAERGLAKTRIADVAERAETSSPAVLYWFGTKNKLLTAALHEDERLFDELVAERLESLDSPSAKLRALFEICAEDANWTLWLELWTRSLHDEPMREAERQVEGRWRGLLTEVIEEGRSTGEFTTDSARERRPRPRGHDRRAGGPGHDRGPRREPRAHAPRSACPPRRRCFTPTSRPAPR